MIGILDGKLWDKLLLNGNVPEIALCWFHKT